MNPGEKDAIKEVVKIGGPKRISNGKAIRADSLGRVQSGAGRSEQGITEILGLHGGQGHGREGGRAGGDRGGGGGGCPPSTSGACAGQSAQGGNVIEVLGQDIAIYVGCTLNTSSVT